ncbi:PAS domain S-box protein [Aureimonas fodinaquatilis]|uniref:Blue-light-activated histidine kinase n=1 Tax=Aureimonas fodinaquatilis TaxID=2565783 RepID=A0A5B0E1X5_9HYPH|nr:PAS domain S-box protein [Aureimonas fodinaquatilis]KAA0972125.1 PAS domain S-box protein [Aureimonas fodinaquatilis]
MTRDTKPIFASPSAKQDFADLRRQLEKSEAGVDDLEAQLADARLALEQCQSRYRLIINSIADYAIVATDVNGLINLWTESATLLFGWPEQRMLGRSIEEIFTESDVLDKVPSQAMRAALTNNASRSERWHRRADGSHFFASGEVTLLRDSSDELAGFLHILRDRTNERKVQHELEASRERLDYAMSASSLVGTWDWDVVNNVVYTDDKLLDFFGLPDRPGMESRPIEFFYDGAHPDDRELLKEKIEQACVNGTAYSHEFRIIDRGGATHWVSAQGRCYLDASGNPVRFPGALIDITQDKLREARQAALLQLTDNMQGVSSTAQYQAEVLEVIGRSLAVAGARFATLTADHGSLTIIGEWSSQGAGALHDAAPVETIASVLFEKLRSDGIFVVDDVQRHPTTRFNAEAWQELGIGSFIAAAVVEHGKIELVLLLCTLAPRKWQDEELAFVRDALSRSWTYSQRQIAEQAQIEAETRLRLAQEAADLGTFDLNIENDVLDFDLRCREIFGILPDQPITFSQHFIGAVVNADRAGVADVLSPTHDLPLDDHVDLTFRIADPDNGAIRHVHLGAQRIFRENVVVRMVGAVRDVTDEMTSAARQKMLTEELHHRVKTTLATVGALANLTFRRAATTQAGLASFSNRLMALNQAHEILTQANWTSASIREIVARSLAFHQSHDLQNISTSGPFVPLTARQSLALSLALHELSVNSTKFGALSSDAGHVAIEWSVTAVDKRPHLHFEWRETGGPVVVAPTRLGLGTKLIRQSLPAELNGRVDLTFDPEGVVCIIDAPLA